MANLLTCMSDAIERLHDNWSAELPRGWMDWRHRETIEGLDVIAADLGDIPNLESTPVGNVLAIVVSPSAAVDQYIDDHADGTLDIPEYYSDFPGGDEPVVPSDTGPCLWSNALEGALRVLNGGDRYDRGEYTLHDCLGGGDPMPCPLIREDVGCILISPALPTG